MELEIKERIYPAIRNELLDQLYSDIRANYLIENSFTNNGKCIIYFSGHGIFFPETEEEFEKKIICENRFEWYNTRIDSQSKSIFVRDIYKNFYVYGINEKLNSIDAMLELFIKETNGYEVITVGSSAGGYAAMLFGALLRANKIYCFSGQVDLWKYFDFPNKVFLKKYQNDNQRSRYYNLLKFIESADNTHTIYITPSKCKEDLYQVSQLKRIQSSNITIISIRSRKHGVPVLKESIPFLFTLSEKDIQNLGNHTYGLFYFTLIWGGGLGVWFKGIIHLFVKGIKLIIDRINNVRIK